MIQTCFIVTKYSLNSSYSNIITYTLLIYFNLSVIKIEQPWNGICIIINYDEFHSNFVFISYTPAYHFYWVDTRFSVRPTLMSFTKKLNKCKIVSHVHWSRSHFHSTLYISLYLSLSLILIVFDISSRQYLHSVCETASRWLVVGLHNCTQTNIGSAKALCGDINALELPG